MTISETVSLVVPFHVAEPLTLLAAAEGQPRWAWQDERELVIAWGQTAVIEGHAPESLREQLADLRLSGISLHPQVRLFGGFPFSVRERADAIWGDLAVPRFVLPRFIFRQTARSSTLLMVRPGEDVPSVPRHVVSSQELPVVARWRDVPDYDGWVKTIAAAKEKMAQGEMEKVVLARAREVEFERLPDLVAVFARLQRRYPHTYRFYFEPQPGRVFMGATPETLVRTRGHTLETIALAGSARRGQNPEEDRQLGEALLRSPKNRREQAIVVAHICSSLRPLCSTLCYPERPHLHRLPNIQHLATPIEGRLHSAGVFAPALAMHPTPALGGYPRPAAMQFIAAQEALPRGLYGAPVGWVNLEGDGLLAVGIRSAVFAERRGRLYAGAGILPASQPESEWQETALKFRPLMEALGLEG
ncbi:MAG: isochorismate synthase [Anaerolineae bacterium]|nr:MAG: isochorismate synthase [Anaerolineae bacterium]